MSNVCSRVLSDIGISHRCYEGYNLFPPATRIHHHFSMMSHTASTLAPFAGVLKSSQYYMHAHRLYSPFPMMTSQLNAYLSVCAIGTFLDELAHKAQYTDISVGKLQQYVCKANHGIKHYMAHTEHQLLIGLSMPFTSTDFANCIHQPTLSPYHTAL